MAFYDSGYSQGRLHVPPTVELDHERAHVIVQALLNTRFALDDIHWSWVRDWAREVIWWERTDHFVFMVGQWQDRQRLQIDSATLRDGRLEGMVNLMAEGITQAHVAVALALAWDSPNLRDDLEPARWRRFFADLTVAERPTPTEDTRPTATLRAELVQPDPYAHEPGQPLDGALRFWLIQTSKRTGKPLKPKKAPKSLAAADKKVRLPEGDRRCLRLAEQRGLMGHIRSYRYVGSVKVDAEARRLDAELLAALEGVSALIFEDEPVLLGQPEWRPVLRVLDGDDGLALAWADKPRAIFEAGYVIDGQNALRRLAADLPPEVQRLLEPDVALPNIPATEIDAFIEDFVLAAGIPVRIEARRLQTTRARPQPRLLLTEEGEALRVEVRFGYGETQIDPSAPVQVVQAGDRLVQRDLDAERAALAELTPYVPSPPPTRLHGEAVFDFLLDALPALEDWTVFFDQGSRARRPRGTIQTQTSVESGVDWFDLQVDFEVAGKRISQREVLRAWAEGKRYVKLGDGSVARLPGEWLKRHGAALAELSELRSATDGKLGAFAAPLAERLMGEVSTQAAERWQSIAERVQRFDRVAERPVPAGVNATLRDYQHRGFRWLCALRDLGLGGLLADDMGLGKTLQTLAFLAEIHADPKAGQSLVVAPTSVVHNWIEEARRFTPGLSIALHHGSKRGDLPTDAQIIVTSYALMRIDRAALEARDFAAIVLDEAQAIKTPTSQVAQAARALKGTTRIALTGTPIENNLLELWSLMQYVMPGFFGGKAAFTRRYANPIQKHDNRDALAALRRRVRPFVLRRLKDEVARELPPRQEQVLYCELGPAQRRLYEKVRTTYAATVLQSVDQKGVGGATIQVLEALTRLRQACCDPGLLPMAEAAGVTRSAKRERLMQTVHALIDDGHRALVFSQWPSLLKRVRADLDAAQIDYLYLDGGTKERGSLQARWNHADGPPLFLISLKAGGTGLNLTAADHVIHLDPWWNPAAEQQATDRAHRIGQTRPVMVYKFVARGTVEEKIIELQARKKALAEAAVDGDRIAVDALTRADLEAVFAPLGAAPPVDDAIDEVEPTDEDADQVEAPASSAHLPPAIAELLDAGPIRTAEVVEALGVSAPTARKRLAEWIDAGWIIKTGRGRAVRYTYS